MAQLLIVGVNLPGRLEYHLVHILEECRGNWIRIVAETILAFTLQAGKEHRRVLIVLLTIDFLAHVSHYDDVVPEGVGKVGVEEYVLSVLAVDDFAALPFCRLAAQTLEDIADV